MSVKINSAGKLYDLPPDERDAEIERLRTDNQRLRTALRQIAEASDWHPADMQAFARAVAWQT